MSQIKIIFFDVDGTLIDMRKGKISDRTLGTLKSLQANDYILCLATGRGPLALPRFEDFEFDAYLTFNGSYCFDKEQTLLSNPIPKTEIDRLVRNATNLKRPLSIASDKLMIANGKDQDLVDYFAFAHQEVVVSEDFERVVAESDIYQIMMGLRERDYPVMMEGIQQAKITAWWDRAVDIIPANGGKGNGVHHILEKYQLAASQAMAFGDGNNDIELLQAVGLGVAMANASDDLKAVADDLCGHVAEDGVYHYCKAMGLI